MKLYFTLEIGDESQNRTWILMSSVIQIQLQELFNLKFCINFLNEKQSQI